MLPLLPYARFVNLINTEQHTVLVIKQISIYLFHAQARHGRYACIHCLLTIRQVLILQGRSQAAREEEADRSQADSGDAGGGRSEPGHHSGHSLSSN